MDPTRVLIVAHKTAATPALIEAVRERAARGPCTFTLLVPNTVGGLAKARQKQPAATAPMPGSAPKSTNVSP